MYQCKLNQDNTYQTAWIEDKGAKVGLYVEVPGDGFWRVDEVYEPRVADNIVKLKEHINRNAFASLS
jgi:hypothetical protein